MTRSPFVLLALTCVVLSSCDALSGLSEDRPNADGTYKGDFQVHARFTERTSTGSYVYKEKIITGAVGFTIQGLKVITTPSAGEGEVTWDDANKTMWVKFRSVASSNESYCSRWEYYGGLRESDQFLKGEGGITCVAPMPEYVGFEAFPKTYWTVRRQ